MSKLWKRVFNKLTKKKALDETDVQTTELRRCLSTLDLTGLGIGCTLGAGMYVVSGQVAHDSAGPAVVISFLVAAVASALAALCYAEFASRIPRAGSAYVYSYVSVGELMAFVIGWNLVLEYIIGTATLARSWSNYMDSLCDNQISHFFKTTIPIHGSSQLSEYPDLLAVILTFVVTVILGVGVKESVRVNNLITCVNLFVVVYVTICGLFKLDWHNWNLGKHEIPPSGGEGGFLPYGISGMMSGAATCFFAFIGFDVIATAGEESKTPSRSIPIAICVSLFVVFVCYFSVSAVLTLMCPYYLLDTGAPLPQVFKMAGWGVARYVISTGAIAGLTTSLLAGMLPLPRVLYAMGTDGVIFKFLGKVSPRFQTPITGTVISGIVSALMSMVFNVQELVKMMSIGTLLAYTLVSISVLILRYEPESSSITPTLKPPHQHLSHKSCCACVSTTVKLLVATGEDRPTVRTSKVAKATIGLMCVLIVLLSSCLIFCDDALINGDVWAIVLVCGVFIVVLCCVLVLHKQPQELCTGGSGMCFKVPLVPFLPAISCLINIYLMLKLSTVTWIRFAVWMTVGFIVYAISGVCYSDAQVTNQDPDDVTLTCKDKAKVADDNASLSSQSRDSPTYQNGGDETSSGLYGTPRTSSKRNGGVDREGMTSRSPTHSPDLNEKTGLLVKAK